MLEVGLFSETGGRSCNQDYAGGLINSQTAIIAVADGLGSYTGSEIASKIAVKNLLKWYEKYLSKPADDLLSDRAMNSAFKSAHKNIIKSKFIHPEIYTSCTTLSAVVSDGNSAAFGHIGDTRIYYFSQGDIKRTRDHSLAQLAVDRGEILEKDIPKHKDQNKLTRVVGSEYFVQPDFQYIKNLNVGDVVIICTDGVWELIPDEKIKEIAFSGKSAEEIASLLKETAKSAVTEFSDNFSAAVLKKTEDKS